MTVRNLLRRAGLALGVAALLGVHATPLAVAAPAAGPVCVDAHGSESARVAGGEGRGVDHEKLDPAVLRQVDAKLRDTSRSLALNARSARIPTWVVIDVYVTNVYGDHAGERDLGEPGIRNAIAVLNQHYAGKDEAGSLATRYVFRLMAIRTVRADGWYHSAPNSDVDMANKRRYHRGDRRDLNLYLREPRLGADTLLGYASFPWQVHQAPLLDGVTVHPESLPGRRLAPYNQGDTTTHEVGHWLGLLHVFEGGCANRDGVADTTPQQAIFECRQVKGCGSLLGGGYLNNPFNYMQYTPDACMRTFSRGQVARMDSAWMSYRN